MNAITDDPGIPNHDGAVAFLSRLILDLKLRELGEEHEPITMARLHMATAYITRDIAECRRRVPVVRVGEL